MNLFTDASQRFDWWRSIWLTPDDFLRIIPEHRQNGFAMLIATALTIKIYLLLALLTYVILRRLKRMWSRRNNSSRIRVLRSIFSTYLLDPSQPVLVRRTDRLFFRRLLLAELEEDRTYSQVPLQKLYRQLGYFEEDLKDLRSRMWARRLAALIRLEIVRSQDSSRAIFEHIHDDNDLVAIAAMRALSALEFPEDIDQLLDSLARRAPARKDIFVEILTNIGSKHSDKILKYLSDCYDPFIATVCIAVLSDLKETRAIPICRALLRSSNDEVVAAAARTLGRLAAVDSISDLRQLLGADNSTVRVEAMIALIALGDSDFAMNLQSVQGDPSPIVQRALFEGTRGRS